MRCGLRWGVGEKRHLLAHDIAATLAAAMEEQRAPALGLGMLARHRDQRRRHPGDKRRFQFLLIALRIVA